jgi:hypothetical protein
MPHPEYDGTKDAPLSQWGLTLEEVDAMRVERNAKTMAKETESIGTGAGEHWSNDDAPPASPIRTQAILMDAVEKALRSIPIARISMGETKVKPKYAVEFGTGLLSAEVTVKFSMLFARPGDAE